MSCCEGSCGHSCGHSNVQTEHRDPTADVVQARMAELRGTGVLRLFGGLPAAARFALFQQICSEADREVSFSPGSTVTVHSLRSAEWLNGKTGTVMSLDKDRVIVDLGGEAGQKSLRPQNLRAVSEPPKPLSRNPAVAVGDSLELRSGDDLTDGEWKLRSTERGTVTEVGDDGMRLRNAAGDVSESLFPHQLFQLSEGQPLIPRYERAGDEVLVRKAGEEYVPGVVLSSRPFRVQVDGGPPDGEEYDDVRLALDAGERVEYLTDKCVWQPGVVVATKQDGSAADVLPQSGQELLSQWPENALRRHEVPQRSQWLGAVQHWLRRRVEHEVDGRVPGEQLCFPGEGTGFEEFTPQNTVAVDSFLYGDDDIIDQTVDLGRLTRAYCTDCGSKRCKPVRFVTHSMPSPLLHFLFEPSHGVFGEGELRGKTLVDVGSRTGACLWAAHRLRGAELAAVIGVEISSYFCAVQRDCAERFAPQVRIVESDCFSGDGLSALKAADVLILNNVFQWFHEHDAQRALWQKLRACLEGREGVTIISVPALEELLAPVGLLDSLGEWLEPVHLRYPEVGGEDDDLDEETVQNMQQIRKYRALGR
eukprot:TRINITY_DN6341_c0_g1_i1.p1 TRINITY_DN6341_c0_g1~~TRINITY_DN6341_c0_g1_i1.p1  ORF type:complete len:609 (+),score=156.56 TRINITY_DN6341_c0_g1_i1:56-1828(+)